MQLPLFPSTTRLLSPTWGVFEKDDSVYYLHNGTPVYTHLKSDICTYRFVTGSLVLNKSCTAKSLGDVFGVGAYNFRRYSKQLEQKGAESFYGTNDRRGKCHIMTPEKIQIAQQEIDSGSSQCKAAKKIGVSESAIRYHIRKGTIKKK